MGSRSPEPSQGRLQKALDVLLLALAAFQLYVAVFGTSSAMLARTTHWGVLAVYGFLRPGGGRPLFRWLWAAIAATTGLYITFSWERIALSGGVTNAVDSLVGAVAVLMVLEATRRFVGLPLVLIDGALLLYGLAGHLIPGYLGHRFLPWHRLVDFLYASTEGIYGIPIGVSTTYIATFLIFGAVLKEFGGASLFLHLAQALAGRFRGGAGKIAVVSSALVGTITGSAAANVATTGVFTIPAMKASGYRPAVAGAIEAVASSGGQIMPPVMGAAAFIMAEMTGVPYARIMVMGLIPALLYFWSVFVMVDLEAAKHRTKDELRETKPLGEILRREGLLLLPLVLLVVLILQGRSAMQAATLATALQVILGSLSRHDLVRLPQRLYRALVSAMGSALPIATACAAAGLIIGVLGITGLGPKTSQILLGLSGDTLLLALFLTMVASIVLGCGLPTTAAYIVLATVAVPALERLGAPAMAAHFFVLYFGAFSTITPPVALASYTAAGIAQEDMNQVALEGLKFGAAAFILPYIWVFSPGLLGLGSASDIAVAALSGAVSVTALAAAIQGYALVPLTAMERLASLAGAVLVMQVGSAASVAGFTLLAALAIHQWRRGRKDMFRATAGAAR